MKKLLLIGLSLCVLGLVHAEDSVDADTSGTDLQQQEDPGTHTDGIYDNSGVPPDNSGVNNQTDTGTDNSGIPGGAQSVEPPQEETNIDESGAATGDEDTTPVTTTDEQKTTKPSRGSGR